MPEPPRPVRRRPDDSAADMGSLVDLGVAPEQPEPSPIPPPTPPPVGPQEPDEPPA